MSTTLETRAGRHARSAKDNRAPDSGSSRWSDWTSSWRVALRMARRDLRRHKGRSAVVIVMVGVPMLIFSFLASIGWVTSPLEQRPEHLLGAASALVYGPTDDVIIQDGATQTAASGPDAATAIPGFDPDATPADNAAAIEALTGGVATPVADQYLRVQLGDRRVAMSNLALDGRVGFGDKVQLLSGRWPSGPNEALVSEQGVRKGLPESGTFDMVVSSGDTISTETITVTGTGTGVQEWGMIPHLISAEPLGPAEALEAVDGRWLITDADMPFSKVGELGAYGLFVRSAELIRNPVPRSELPPELHQMSYSDGTAFIWLTLAIVLAMIIGLLVAPAFAVSASRQRHTLALAASNGATTRQLRRTVLAQALVLGALSAVVGSAVGVGIAAAMAHLHAARSADVRLPIFTVPWVVVIGLTAAAIVAAITAALFPARRLGRLDIMGVLKGQNVSGPPSRIVPVVGAAVMALSSVGLLWGARKPHDGEMIVAFASIGVVVGALSLVPIALVAIGRVGSALPVALRMSSRDAARQRTRSVPTVAAVMGGVAALTIGLIAGFSDAKESETLYIPRTIMGQGMVMQQDSVDRDTVATVLHEQLPEAAIIPYAVAGDDYYTDSAGPRAFAVLAKPECSVGQVLFDKEHTEAQEAAFDAATDQDAFRWQPSPCLGLGGPEGHGEIAVLPAAQIIDRLELTGEQAELARSGAVFATQDVLGQEAIAYAGTFVTDPDTYRPRDIEVASETSLPVVVVPESATRSGAMFDPTQVAALVSTEVAEEAGWALRTYGFVVDAPDGISDDQRTAVNERLSDAEFFVERGWQNDTTRFFVVLIAAVSFLLLVVILTATALSMAEQRRDDSTLAAVGATRGTRRAIAAAQAFVVSIVGAVLGLIVGIIPGLAFAYPLTRAFPNGVNFDADGQPLPDTVMTGPFVVIPYVWLAFLAIGVPVLAALFSALAVRRAPVVTRRAD